jgi:hypothetical protein
MEKKKVTAEKFVKDNDLPFTLDYWLLVPAPPRQGVRQGV